MTEVPRKHLSVGNPDVRHQLPTKQISSTAAYEYKLSGIVDKCSKDGPAFRWRQMMPGSASTKAS
jgi:hypothetical protein